ncbi:unnamed protein product [Owenia fusiformis]|uniref:Uncharacterized protein n=1 Tax=Owenia fusiformis TaxID=6347 RepID=A0A8J1XJ73_OWEFU|nr:unnamed protein product [Owenia fusiformis]
MKLLLLFAIVVAVSAGPIPSRSPVPKHLVSRLLQLAERDSYDTLLKDAIRKGKGDEFKAQYKKDKADEKKEYYDGMRQAVAAGQLDAFYKKVREMQTEEAQGYWDIYMNELHASKDKTREELDKRTDWKSQFHRAHKEARKYGKITEFWKIVRQGGLPQEDEVERPNVLDQLVEELFTSLVESIEESIKKSHETQKQKEAEEKKLIEDINKEFEELPVEKQNELLEKKAQIEKDEADRKDKSEKDFREAMDLVKDMWGMLINILVPEEERGEVDEAMKKVEIIMDELLTLILVEESEETGEEKVITPISY